MVLILVNAFITKLCNCSIPRYDDYRDPTKEFTGGIEKTPDHRTFYYLATTYAKNNMQMRNTSETCPRWGYFKDGVTNGADW